MLPFCHRCGEELTPRADDPAPNFCPHCGAPQLFISPDHLLTLQAAADPSETTGQLPPPHPDSIRWRPALQAALIISGIAAMLWLLSLVVPFVGALCWLWIFSGSLLVLELYRRREPSAHVSASVGARLGLAFGLTLDAALALALAAAGLVARFVTHSLGPVDAQITAMLQQQTAQAAATVPDPAELLHLFATPEFRAGLVLSVLVLFAAMLLAVSALSGALAGLVARPRPQPR